MNSGIGKLIGSASYELASDELARRRPSTKPGPSPANALHNTPAQGCARPTARQAQRAPKAAAVVGCVARAVRARAWRTSWAAVRACVFVFAYET